MEIMQLRGFCAVVEEKKFSKAAKRIFVSQPAISMQVKALEYELQEELVIRSRKAILPTPAGKILYQHAKHALEELELAQQKIQELKGAQIGHLSIGCSDTVSNYILPNILSGFLRKFPKVEISIQNKPTMQIIQFIQEMNVDIGIVSLPFANPQLQTQPLFEFKEVALCSKEHPLAGRKQTTLKELTQYRLLVLEATTRSRFLLEKAFAEIGEIPESMMEFGSVEVQKSFAEINLGVAIVPEFSLPSQHEKLVSIEIKDIPKRWIGIVYRSREKLSKIAETFLLELTAQKEFRSGT